MIQVLVVVMMIAVTTLMWTSAGRAPEFQRIFDGLFKDMPLPSMTQFFFDHGQTLTWSYTLASLTITVLIITLNRKIWPPALALAISCVGLIGAQMAKEALLLPIVGIIQGLT